MKTYKITMTPTLHMTAEVKANSVHEAIQAAEERYKNGEFDFGHIDVDDVEFQAEEQKRSRDYER